jgi:fatty acid desaturase
MSMNARWLHALLGLSMFVVPAVFMFGMVLGAPALAFLFVMFVLPLMRPVFGRIRPDEQPLWSERVATLLDWLPVLYALLLVACLALLFRHLSAAKPMAASDWIALGLSGWMLLLFATSVAHELIHRRDARQRLVGHLLCGVAGYPLLAHEHLRHHGRPGDTALAEWPCHDESVWRFAARRCRRIVREGYGTSSPIWRTGSHHSLGLRVATAATLLTVAVFALAGGIAGLIFYLVVALGVAFGMQLFTYIQHWGLGDDRQGDKAARELAWEDDCRFQAWITLGSSLHHTHHQSAYTPYYRCTLAGTSPRLPAGYVILMVICLFPALWRAAMRPALQHWEQHPDDPKTSGRRLTCFHLYDDGGAHASPVRSGR